ncbi:hypothetical protein GCM10017783_23270 [Deinococcus piscis]|uniref:Uncharacterized protein n=1 Tax=Deinococcus piscis TaxID=394230 RepID=A0ABQ3KA21_9DEIO|nr:hypothetical protein GCM10017783_23270 [Deinococcus piscis]
MQYLTASRVSLSPLSLRPAWEAGALTVASAKALLKRHDSQREDGNFSALLRVLAQQPAYSLVTSVRLAEQLGSLDAAHLNQLLTVLTQPPFRLLSPLGQGEYLLHHEVPEYLRAKAQNWQVLAANLDSKKPFAEASPVRTWTAEQLLD